MLFIWLLTLTTTIIAAAAAFFSVYGLAQLFTGISTMVIIMGSSLEAGKLMAASYLYRYWKSTPISLKLYLMVGILSIMLLTSAGIFSILSAGYQTDSLPLKQIQSQVKSYDDEKARLLDRKSQIDNQIAKLPPDMVKGRVRLIANFKQEQATTTERIANLDKIMIELKTKLIQTEAHTGPITYIASAFGGSPDQATKYLILLIVLAFDPMAVALTLAVNIALRQRALEQQTQPDSVATIIEEPPLPITPSIAPYSDDYLNYLDLINKELNATPIEIDKTFNPPVTDGRWTTEEYDEVIDTAASTIAKLENQIALDKKERDELIAALEDEISRNSPDVQPVVESEPEVILEPVTDDIPETRSIQEIIGANKPPTARFGTEFPIDVNKGDTFLRVDYYPSMMYKWNGENWIEINKETTDALTYNTQYINHLIEKVSNGEYQIEDLSDAEQDAIRSTLSKSQ